ncbi:MAG: hypothetical protein WD431_09015 [Cyclobacteriaceae bacterium]
MAYQIDLSGQASKDIEFHKKSGNKALFKKLSVLLEELTEHTKGSYIGALNALTIAIAIRKIIQILL